MADPTNTAFARLPKIDRLLADPRLSGLALRRGVVRRAAQDVLDRLRADIREALAAARPPSPIDEAAVVERVAATLERWTRPPEPVLNATGVLLHTNLGRAPLSRRASEAVRAIAEGYCDLELELATGKRGSRMARVAPLLAALSGAEAALVVNNGAAALLLACTALGQPGGVALSRGQMVEIGDGFRVAEMAAAGGVSLWPIGSTNRTHRHDYAEALAGALPGMREPASALLWIHRSNFVQQGFVGEPSLRELAELAAGAGAVAGAVPLIADLGSGALAGPESIPALIEQGASVVIGSGDKLFGGPQAGLLLGDAAAIARCRRHPLARALRLDKLSLAALHATAIAHARPDALELPLDRMLAASLDSLRTRGEALCRTLAWPRERVRASEATVGGGSLPGELVASVALVIPERHAEPLRRGTPAMIGRLHAGELWLDLRTLLDVDDATLIRRLAELGA
ncbi:L-seryl-tRNA(Sec) selenium transferase [Nannocystaceae bacterium ST9]